MMLALGCAAIPSGACGARTNLICDFDLSVRDRPSLYFVLDRSLSMKDGDKWGTVRTDVSRLILRIGSAARFGAAMFPAPGMGGCAPGVEVMPLRDGDEPGIAGPTVDLFLKATDLAPSGGTPTATTLDGLAPLLRAGGQTYVVLATDGGPNCIPDATCDLDKCTANLSSLSAFCQPGVPPNCCDVDSGGNPFDCLDESGAEAAVAKLASEGVPVFVIGIAGSAPYAALLERLAAAGGMAKPTVPAYYRVDTLDAEALAAALSDIVTRVGRACRQSLEVPNGAHITSVSLDDALAPIDDWSYDGKTISLSGRSCERMRAGAALHVYGAGECRR
jgi:hypothetical protein